MPNHDILNLCRTLEDEELRKTTRYLLKIGGIEFYKTDEKGNPVDINDSDIPDIYVEAKLGGNAILHINEEDFPKYQHLIGDLHLKSTGY